MLHGVTCDAVSQSDRDAPTCKHFAGIARNVGKCEETGWQAKAPAPPGWSCMNRILIIGATGRVGRHVLSQLPATGVLVRALARNPHTAGLPPHVDVVCGDLTLPETLDACLDGIDAVF